jgi:pyruvate-formate lyase
MDDSRHDDHELHRNLVVRVRGWSGCFCELDGTYQDRIIGLHNNGAERCGTQ